MAEMNYEFRKRMLDVHKKDRRDPERKAQDGEVTVCTGWTVVIPDMSDVVVYNAARDLEDYFAVSMNEYVSFSSGIGVPEKAIVYKIDPSLPENGYGIKAGDTLIELVGADSRSAAQAGYYLEDLMNLNEAPIVTKGESFRTPMFSPRMVHSGVGLDMFPDEHIRAIAHEGINALLIFVKDIDITPHGYQDFNDLIYRASRYGVDVYAYSYMLSKVHPEDPSAPEFYENLYGRLFERCPGFKGIIFVGESCEFPSKDPHTTGILRLDNMDEDGNYIIKDKPSPGWWPCYDYPQWIDIVKKSIYAKKPDAEIVFWTYNWGYVEEKYRLELLRNIPTDITLLVTFEMFEDVIREGIANRTVDYTLFFEGPGKYFESEAKLAKERGIKLYAMTNTGGLTWDIGTIPFEPAPYQWMRRYKEMRRAHDEWGLCGTMDSHHYGFYPSFISDLAKWAFVDPEVDLDEILYRLAVRDFSKETANTVLEAYRLFSDGIRMLISTNEDQYGPFRVGPSYPLLLFRDTDAEFPTVPYAENGGNQICNPMYTYDISTPELLAKINYEIKCHTMVAEMYEKGADMLDGVIPKIAENKRADAQRLANMCRYMAKAAQTTVNVKEWKKLKERLIPAAEEERKEIIAKMRIIGEREIENAKSAIPLVQFDSRLGFEPSMEYMCDELHLNWKIALTKRVLDEELDAPIDKNVSVPVKNLTAPIAN